VSRPETTTEWEERFYPATELAFDDATEKHRLKVLFKGADRHGSIVWEATEERDGHRYVTVSVTRTDDDWPNESPRYNVEVWAAAGDDTSHTRRLVASFDPAGLPVVQYVQILNAAVVAAIGRARKITREEFKLPDELRNAAPSGEVLPHTTREALMAAAAVSAVSVGSVGKMLQESPPRFAPKEIPTPLHAEVLHLQPPLDSRIYQAIIDELTRTYIEAASTWVTDDLREWIEQALEMMSKSMAEAMIRSNTREGSR
jgi:hypothetical protein